jgi:prepilin-type N-terminal cleavage/methylation domain-containing protein
MRAPTRRRGFTLVEVLVAVVIAAAIAGAATIALFQALRAQTASQTRQQARARADAVASRMALDLENLLRDGDLYNARVLITSGGTASGPRDELLVFASSATSVRTSNVQNEGGRYEIQYRLLDPPVLSGGERRRIVPGAPASLVLWRRVDPIPDEVPDGGGVVFPVGEGIISLSVEGFDGEAWQESWDSDRDGLPHAVRVRVRSMADADPRRTAAAVRVVAIDRVPLPYVKVVPEDESEQGDGG